MVLPSRPVSPTVIDLFGLQLFITNLSFYAKGKQFYKFVNQKDSEILLPTFENKIVFALWSVLLVSFLREHFR